MCCQPIKHNVGTTLVEVMIATSIMLVAVISILFSYVKFLELEEIGRGATISTRAVKNAVEEIKNTSFNDIYSTYNNATFTITGMDGIGKVYIDDSQDRLRIVKVVYCWRMLGRRVIGEDVNLNGVLNPGEDKNGNGQIDSYVQVVTEIFG
jgi:hypothetical protein